MEKTLDSLEKYVLLGTIFLVPVFILPIFPNPYDTAKLALLALGVSIVIVIRAIKTLILHRLEFSLGNFDIPILILAVAYLASGIIISPNKLEAFFLPGTAMLMIMGSLLYFLSNMVFGANKKELIITLVLSGVLLSVLTLLSITGVLAKIPQLPDFMRATLFSPSGGGLPTAMFLLILVPLGIGMVVKESSLVKKLFWGVSVLILLLGLGISSYYFLPGKANSLVLPPFPTSWAVSVESLKQSPILGVGPGNFLSAFGQFRPLAYNATSFWSARFTSASDFFLTLLAEVGLLGFAGYLLIFVAAGKEAQKNIVSSPWASLSLFLTLALSLLVPANLVFLVAFFLILSIYSGVKPSQISVSPPFMLIVPAFLAIAVFWFFAGRVLIAEAKFEDALVAINKNDAKGAFASLNTALTLDPYVDRYHATYAQLDLVVARSISQKKDLTDTDKNNVAQAIQAAISEGKATVALNPQRSANWALLGGIYQAVMPFAQGADNFTIQSYSQAIALDPIDPNLRITLGGVYYALGRYDDAIQSFQLATYAKPDLANAHYNLSAAYREKGNFDNAISEMQTVLTLVPKNSNDYKTGEKELEDLQQKKSASAKTPSGQSQASELTSPTKVAPAISPQITLPSEATPPGTP